MPEIKPDEGGTSCLRLQEGSREPGLLDVYSGRGMRLGPPQLTLRLGKGGPDTRDSDMMMRVL